jgi:hypothetical protein
MSTTPAPPPIPQNRIFIYLAFAKLLVIQLDDLAKHIASLLTTLTHFKF